MIHSVRGTVTAKGDNFAVLETSNGLGLKVFAGRSTLQGLHSGAAAFLFTFFNVKEDALDLYGFATEEELRFFELLLGVNGVGPKSALSIMEVAPLRELAAAIQESRVDLLRKASGIGQKTAERIIIELKNKVDLAGSAEVVERMEADSDLVDTLAALGYKKEDARQAIAKLPREMTVFEEKLKHALKLLAKK